MAKKTLDKSSRKRIDRRKVEYACLVTIWAGLALTLSQFIVAEPMLFLLGERLATPFWMLVYYILSYALTLILVLIAPPYLYKFLRQHFLRIKEYRKTKRKNQEKSLVAKKNVVSEYTVATNSEELGLKNPITFVDIGLAPIGYVVYAILANIILTIMSGLPWFDPDQTQDVGFSGYIAGFDRIYAMIAIVFVAPIAEELLMRGWLYGKLRNQLKAWAAILIVSLLFAFLHGQWNVAVSVFMLSLVLCSLREITGSIWSGILLHILTNGIAFYIVGL